MGLQLSWQDMVRFFHSNLILQTSTKLKMEKNSVKISRTSNKKQKEVELLRAGEKRFQKHYIKAIEIKIWVQVTSPFA